MADRATLCLIDNGDYRWVPAGKPSGVQDVGRLAAAQKSVRTVASSPINLDSTLPSPQSAQICDVCEYRWVRQRRAEPARAGPGRTGLGCRIFCVSRSARTISCVSRRVLLGFVLSARYRNSPGFRSGRCLDPLPHLLICRWASVFVQNMRSTIILKCC